MKKVISILSVAVLLNAMSCKKNTSSSSSYKPDCTGTTPKFSADVSPLINSSCSGGSCHSAGSVEGPGPLTNYGQVKNAVTDIRKAIVNGTMPKSGSLTTAQKNTIVCWIDAGANND